MNAGGQKLVGDPVIDLSQAFARQAAGSHSADRVGRKFVLEVLQEERLFEFVRLHGAVQVGLVENEQERFVSGRVAGENLHEVLEVERQLVQFARVDHVDDLVALRQVVEAELDDVAADLLNDELLLFLRSVLAFLDQSKQIRAVRLDGWRQTEEVFQLLEVAVLQTLEQRGLAGAARSEHADDHPHCLEKVLLLNLKLNLKT